MQSKSSPKLPLILMLWPLAAIIASLILFAIVNMLSGPQDFNQSPSPLQTITNVLLFLVGAAAIAGGPISFIVGLVLLITRASSKQR